MRSLSFDRPAIEKKISNLRKKALAVKIKKNMLETKLLRLVLKIINVRLSYIQNISSIMDMFFI